jgi:hypothetical protein
MHEHTHPEYSMVFCLRLDGVERNRERLNNKASWVHGIGHTPVAEIAKMLLLLGAGQQPDKRIHHRLTRG